MYTEPRSIRARANAPPSRAHVRAQPQIRVDVRGPLVEDRRAPADKVPRPRHFERLHDRLPARGQRSGGPGRFGHLRHDAAGPFVSEEKVNVPRCSANVSPQCSDVGLAVRVAQRRVGPGRGRDEGGLLETAVEVGHLRTIIAGETRGSDRVHGFAREIQRFRLW